MAWQVDWKWQPMSHKWSCDTANNINWILITVHSIGNSGTNLHNLSAVFKLFGQKCHPSANTFLSQLTIMTTCSSKIYFILYLHIDITNFLSYYSPNHAQTITFFEVSWSHTIRQIYPVSLPWNSDKPIMETATYITQETNVYKCSKIQTHDLSNRAARTMP